MNAVNKTLYIPLYGKAYVSRRGLFLKDADAERIRDAAGFRLGRKSRSKYLAFYMGIRAAVFDGWVREEMKASDPQSTVILHIGCGLDARVNRVGRGEFDWYDLDFPQVIEERKRHFAPDATYHMLAGDATDPTWLTQIPRGGKAVVIMEGVSMYLTEDQNRALQSALAAHFDAVSLLADCYSVFAAKMSRYKNPIGEVGADTVYGIDDPTRIAGDGMIFEAEHEMLPADQLAQLKGFEGAVFRHLYAGRMARGLYRLFGYRKTAE